MNKLMCILVLVALFSCKSNSIAQEKKIEKTNKPKIEKPGFGDPRDNERISFEQYSYNQITPGTIHFTAVIQEIKTDVDICGKKYQNTIVVTIREIKGLGLGIINVLSSSQKITLGYNNSKVKNFDKLKQKFAKSQEVTLVVKENLCPDMTKTVYEILKLDNK